MKKLVLLSLALFICAFSLRAQSGFGVKAGFNFNSMSDLEYNNIKESAIEKKTGFHVGVLYKINLPLGLALQPELLYSQKGGSINPTPACNTADYDGDFKMHYLQLPVNIQWGLDLMLFRPFIMVSPYLSYLLSKDSGMSGLKWDTNKLGYGIGLGAGMDIWKFQVTGKYNWDLGKASEFKWDGAETFKGGKNRGFELSLAFIF